MACSRTRKRIFEGLEIFFVKKRQIRTQINKLTKKIEERGGSVNETRKDSTTHVVYSRGVEKRDIIGDLAIHVRIEWLSECIEHDSLVSCETFKLVSALACSLGTGHYLLGGGGPLYLGGGSLFF